MGSSKKIFSGVAWSLVVTIVNAVYGFIAVPILIGQFGRSEYGLIALANSVNAYIALLDMGLNSTNVRFFSNWLAKGDHVKVKKLMQTCTAFYGVIGIINAIILFAAYSFSDQLFNVNEHQNEILKDMFLILMVSAVINWYTSCFGQLIQATENVAWIQKRTLLSRILKLTVLGLTIVLKLSILQYFVATILAELSLLPLTINKIRKETPFISFWAKFDWPTFKEILPYSLNIFSFGLFQYSFYNLRTVLVGMRGDIESVTDFGVMLSITNLITMVSGVFMGSVLPSTAKAVAQGNMKAYYRVAYQGTKYISIVLCFCCFGLMSVNYDLILIYVGEKFLHLVPWLNLWLFALVWTHNSSISSLILSGSDVRVISYSTIVAATLGLLVSWFSIPVFQAGGPVLAYVIYLFVQLSFYYLYYWPKKMQIDSRKVFCTSFFPYCFFGLITVGIINFMPRLENHYLNILIYGFLFSILYLTLTWLNLKKEDKTFIYSLIGNHDKKL